MKFFKVSLCILFIGMLSGSAQNINQFDSEGKRHGIWKKNFEGTDVLRYEGAFNQGKETGVFKFYKNIDGEPILAAEKVFNDNDSSAYVKFYNGVGKVISEGKMNGKKYVGTWKYYQNGSQQLLTVEHYNEQGILHGQRLVYYKNDQIAEEEHYVNGKLEGVSKWYGENGTLLKTFTYKDDRLHGLSKFYNVKGELVTQGAYKNGKKDGVWRYYENNELVKEEDFTYKPKYIKVDGKYKKAP